MQLKKSHSSLIIATIIAMFIFIWQVIQLLTSDMSSKSAHAAAAITPLSSAAPSTQSFPNDPIMQPTELQKATPTIPTAKPIPKSQQTYVNLINRYQIAKVHHKLLEEELAIAQTEHEISELNQKNMTHSFGTEDNESTNLIKLVYLGYQNEQWGATLMVKGEYETVDTGDILIDGSHVLSINKNGVIIQTKKRRFYLTFNNLIPLPTKYHKKLESKQEKNNIAVAVEHTLPLILPAPTENSLKKPPEEILHHTPPTPTSTPLAVTDISFDETVLLEMPPSSYTIQLLQSTDKSKLFHFAKKYHINNQTLCYTHTDNNLLSYTLLYGDYLTMRAAQLALSNLPKGVRELPISIRHLEEVQREIKGNK